MRKLKGNPLVGKELIYQGNLVKCLIQCSLFGRNLAVWVLRLADLIGGKRVSRCVLNLSLKSKKTSSVGVSFLFSESLSIFVQYVKI